MPDDFEPGKGFDREPPESFDGERPELPEGETMPDGFGHGQMGGKPGQISLPGEGNTLFFIQDKVNFFSGLTPAA